MGFAKISRRGGRAAFVLAVSAVLAVGCGGKSVRSGDDDGSDSTGGTSDGGTATGGSGAANGTGADLATCVFVLKREQLCPRDPGIGVLDCESGCSAAYELAGAFGCALEVRNYYACLSAGSDACNVTDACVNELDTFEVCLKGDPLLTRAHPSRPSMTPSSRDEGAFALRHIFRDGANCRILLA